MGWRLNDEKARVVMIPLSSLLLLLLLSALWLSSIVGWCCCWDWLLTMSSSSWATALMMLSLSLSRLDPSSSSLLLLLWLLLLSDSLCLRFFVWNFISVGFGNIILPWRRCETSKKNGVWREAVGGALIGGRARLRGVFPPPAERFFVKAPNHTIKYLYFFSSSSSTTTIHSSEQKQKLSPNSKPHGKRQPSTTSVPKHPQNHEWKG